jgi:cation transport regulator ChaC
MKSAAKPHHTLIFGYGSLLNLESLQATVPDAFNLRPSYIKGFKRDFCLWATDGFVATNPELSGMPFCAVDIHHVPEPDEVNGVVFEVHQDQLPALLEREEGYTLIATEAYDFTTHEPLGTCFVFAANKHNGDFAFESPAQMRYLNTCLTGAKEHGEKFYQQFIRTTYVGHQLLRDVPELNLK